MTLILGGTGRVGREAVKLLSVVGLHQVRLVSRCPNQVPAFFGRRIQIVTGDIGDSAFLRAAMRGVERVLVIPPNVRNQAVMERGIYRAALSADVNHVVKLSTVKADVTSPCWFFKQHAIAERHLRHSGLNFTILRANSFMQNLLWFAHEIRTRGTFSLPLDDAKTAPVDTRDIAAVAVAVLCNPTSNDFTYNVTGPEKLSFAEIARKLSAAIGRTVTYRDVPSTDFLKVLIQSGMPTWQARAATAAWIAARNGKPHVTNVVAQLTQRRPITFDQFACYYANSFRH